MTPFSTGCGTSKGAGGIVDIFPRLKPWALSLLICSRVRSTRFDPGRSDRRPARAPTLGPATIYIPGGRYTAMADKPSSGEILGIPYNFERPSLGRLLSSYWQPGKGMLVEKPFGIGYTLNLANWRSWIVLAVAGGLYYQQKQSGAAGGADGAGDADAEADDGPVEVIVDDD